MRKKQILAIIGSTRANSSNLKVVQYLAALTKDLYDIAIFERISELPHFNPDSDNENPPCSVVEFRQLISKADGVLICTPEYIYSLPGSLKNAIEWCVSTAVFSQKPIGLITASASGKRAHEELQLIMKTVETNFTKETTLLISGIKGKFNDQGILSDTDTIDRLVRFSTAFGFLISD
ncbi:NADPH-dependent FMN reductase [Flavobacterium taihuense]|uniref:NAD(P)H-dependent oxidoreductase n=1 Tax=Flavobacterium taihuense TaxID=2857508 RepID=A0ABS6XSK2_9FLAO|nr:NADPH-dependent FMN reductase [Flavobacterium taihuense]MBW4358879.1 NAD(P)H-dependent oxidoreductase [Flavobacterium taihuense]